MNYHIFLKYELMPGIGLKRKSVVKLSFKVIVLTEYSPPHNELKIFILQIPNINISLNKIDKCIIMSIGIL